VVRSYRAILALVLTKGVSDSDCFEIGANSRTISRLLDAASEHRPLPLSSGQPVADTNWSLYDLQIKAIAAGAAHVVTFLDPEYPGYLRRIANPPPILFYRGNLRSIDRRGVAIVGARHASAHGCRFAARLAADLASLGVAVVSGAARGIDAAAHRGALGVGGLTVAVTGTGLDVPYPRQNQGLLEEIAAKGCVLTEQLMGTPPLRHTFPLRNRLISGASRAVVVVEAGGRSGALVTAKWALEQGREVGAVPGFPGEFRSRGVIRLLRMGAFPVESVDDVLEAVPLLTQEKPAAGAPATTEPDPDVDDDERAVLRALSRTPIDPDVLARHVGVDVSVLQRLLLSLEISGLVARDLAGAYYKL
jgi:DNA processing protein